MLKQVLKLNGAQALNSIEQKEINGGWDSGFCKRLYASCNHHDPRWSACGFCGTCENPCTP